MKYTPLKNIPDVPKGQVIEAVRGFIHRRYDPENVGSSGKLRQNMILKNAHGECRVTIWEPSLFFGPEMLNQEVILSSTSEDGALKGLRKGEWKDSHYIEAGAGTACETVKPEMQSPHPQKEFKRPTQHVNTQAKRQLVPIADMARLHADILTVLSSTHGPLGVEPKDLLSVATSICITHNWIPPVEQVVEAPPEPEENPCNHDAIAELAETSGVSEDAIRIYNEQQLEKVVEILLVNAIASEGSHIKVAYDTARGNSRHIPANPRAFLIQMISKWKDFLGSKTVKEAKEKEDA